MSFTCSTHSAVGSLVVARFWNMEYGSAAVCWQLGTTMKRTHAHIQKTRECSLKNFSFYIQLINFYRIAFSSTLAYVASDFSSVSTRISIFRMKIFAIATESKIMPSNLSSIRFRFLYAKTTITVSHWTNNFHDVNPSNWKSDDRPNVANGTQSVTPAAK